MGILKGKQLESGSYLLLLENSLRSIPFNILVAALFSFDLLYEPIPNGFILSWFAAIVVISLIRWFYSSWVIRKKYYQGGSASVFLILTFMTGSIWGVAYPIFLPYVGVTHEVIIILIMGGMAAGSVASLSAYLPAYYAYVIPMILPLVIYNYSYFKVERSILATMFFLFVVMVIAMARINSNLLFKIFQLSNQKDSLIDQLSVSNKKLEVSNEEVRLMSLTDSLTGLGNRRYFDSTLPNELSRAKRNNHPLSLLLVDIDNFKRINDSFGHPYGDDYLIFVASILKESIRRSNDIIVRLGGDEFAAILANMDILEARALSNAIKEDFSKENKHNNVTLSIGIICIEPDNGDNLKNIISAADKMLYQAKECGKNQIISQKL